MIEITDFSYLSPEEARKKVKYIQHRIYVEQFQKGFFLRHTNPELHLKYEIHAYLRGAITEMHGWNDIVGQIIQPIEDWITSALSSFWNDILKPGIDAIISGFSAIWNTTLGVVQDIWNDIVSIVQSIADIYQWITVTVWNALSDVWNAIQNLGSLVWNSLMQYLDVVKGALSWFWDNVLKPGFVAVLDVYKTIWNAIASTVQTAVQWAQEAWNAIKAAWEDITKAISDFGAKFWGWVKALPDALSGALESAFGVLKDIAKWIWDHVLVPAGQAIANGLKWVVQQVSNLLYQGVSGLYNVILSLGRMNPLKARDNFPNIMKIVIMAGVGLGGATLMGELMHPLKNLGLGRIAAMMWKATNYDIVTGALVGALAYAALRKPLTYAFHEHFRPELPDTKTAIELRSRRQISQELYHKILSYHGYDDEYYKYFDELANSKLSYFALNAVAKAGYYDEKVFREETLRAGYSDNATKLLLQMYQQTSLEAVKGQYASVVISRYREGIIDENGLEYELVTLGYPEKQRPRLVTGAKLYYDLDVVKDSVAALKYALEHGKISFTEFKARLADLGIRGDVISHLSKIEQMKGYADVYQSQSEEVRSYGKSVVIKRYKEGIITDQDFEQELRMLGYSDAWIKRLKIVARLERDYDYAKEVLSYAQKGYEKGTISEDQFVSVLHNFGFIDEKISLILNLIKLKYGIGLQEQGAGS